MKSNIIKSVFLTALFTGVLAGCVNDDDYSTPNLDCIDSTLSANKTVEEIRNLAQPVVAKYPGTGDDVIEAYVTSSDEGGNFYKSISFQTHPTDGSAPVGFSVPVDAGGTFTNFPPGQKVYIKLKDQYIDLYNGVRIGALYLLDPATETTDAVYAVGRLSIFEYAKVLQRSCTVLNEDTDNMVQHLTVNEAKNDARLNTLIELTDVQFLTTEVGKPYYDSANDVGGATNHLLTDTTGNTVIVRTSSFASFAGDIVPSTSGTIRGVMTKYGADYQFMPRTSNDIKLTAPRLEVDFAPVIVGDNVVFSGTLNENFDSYVTTAPGNKTFAKYINDPVVGSRYWQTTLYGGNKYIQMTSFGGTAENNRSLFFIPVDFTAANTFSFKTLSGYSTGAVLKVYYVSAADYTPGGTVNTAALTDITSSFNIPLGPTNAYATSFTNSGNFVIPASLTGNGYFIFEYVGSGLTGMTTTIEIDNVIIN